MNKTVYFPIRVLLPVFIILFICSSCYKMRDNIGESTAESERIPINLPALYSGTLPCADCPGISYRLIIEENRFTEISVYQDRSPGRFEQTGSWDVSGDTLLLHDSDSSVLKKFLFREEQLILLDRQNQEITGDLADMFVLERTGNQQSIREHHQNLATQGFTFFAGGNEPFWSVRIDSLNRVEFQTPETSLHFGEADSVKNASRIQLRASTDSTHITIQTEQHYCQDSMSGYLFPKTVTVHLKTAAAPDTLSGCGLFLNSPGSR